MNHEQKQLFILNDLFISEHIDELVQLVDYVPISFEGYGAQQERDDFLRFKNLLTTIQEMDQLIHQKCQAYEDPIKARNSVLIEWLDCHPEFEGIIAEESFEDYQKMKINNDLEVIDLLYNVEIPSEKNDEIKPSLDDNLYVKDDSSIQLPDFKKKREIFDKYPATLLACYLSYLL